METRTRWMVVLLLVALAARVTAALAVGGAYHFPDEAIYADAARRLVRGQGFGADYRNVPGYPVFLAILSAGLSVGPVWLRVGQAAVTAVGVIVVFALADRLLGRRVAVAAALVYALDPLVVITSGLLYPETLAALLVPLVVLTAMAAAERNSVGRSAFAGVLLGVLALLRPVALILSPVVAVWSLLAVGARPARRLAHVAVIALACLLVLTPWTVRNYRVQGRFVPVATAGTQAAPVSREVVASEGLVTSMARWAWSEPGALVSRVGRQFVQFWELTPTRLATDDPVRRGEFHLEDSRLSLEPLFSRSLRDSVSAVSFGLELAFALAGLLVLARARRGPALLMLALIFAYAVGYALFVAKLRYRIPVLPLVFVFTGAGLSAAVASARRNVRRAEPDNRGTLRIGSGSSGGA